MSRPPTPNALPVPTTQPAARTPRPGGAMSAPAVPPAARRDHDLDLVAGLLEHIACVLQSGCPQAARRALLLVDRIVGRPDAGTSMRAHAEHLQDALEEQLAERKPAPAVPAGRAGGTADRPTHRTQGLLPC